jgi:uncharacterized protein YdaU (DUF1376 family)
MAVMKGEFYKMDFRAWNVGTVDLTLEQEAAYLRLCHAMYDVGGPVPNSTRFLQGIFRCGNTKAVALVAHLIAAGKIAVTNDGRLFNHRVSEELAERERVSAVRRAAGERGGSAPRATAERLPSDHRPNTERLPTEGRATASKSLENQESHEAIALTLRSRGEEIRGEKIQKKDKPSSDSARGAQSPRKRKIDPDWQLGTAEIAAADQSGVSPVRAAQIWPAFIDHHVHHGTLGLDWIRGWRTWCRNDAKFSARDARQRPRSPPKTADFWAGDAIDANAELTGGRYDNRPFNRDADPWDRSGEPGGVRSYESAAQQVGADPWGLPPLRVIGGGRA